MKILKTKNTGKHPSWFEKMEHIFWGSQISWENGVTNFWIKVQEDAGFGHSHLGNGSQ